MPGERPSLIDRKCGRRAIVKLDCAHKSTRTGIPNSQCSIIAGGDDPTALVGGADRGHRSRVTGKTRHLSKIGRLARHDGGAATLIFGILFLVGDGEAGYCNADQQL